MAQRTTTAYREDDEEHDPCSSVDARCLEASKAIEANIARGFVTTAPMFRPQATVTAIRMMRY